MKIPELGSHYKATWYQQDQEAQNAKADARNRNANTRKQQVDFDVEEDKWGAGRGGAVGRPGGTADDKDKSNLKCGDITSRILSALVEDQLLPAGYVTILLRLFRGKVLRRLSNSILRFLSNTYSLGREGNPDGVGEDGTDGRNATAGVGAVAGAPNVQEQHKLAEIDDVLKNELLSLGLLEDNDGNVNVSKTPKMNR